MERTDLAGLKAQSLVPGQMGQALKSSPHLSGTSGASLACLYLGAGVALCAGDASGAALGVVDGAAIGAPAGALCCGAGPPTPPPILRIPPAPPTFSSFGTNTLFLSSPRP